MGKSKSGEDDNSSEAFTDASGSVRTDGTTVEGEEDETNLADMKKVFMDTRISLDGKDGKRKSLWTVSMETWGMAHGKDGDGDLWLETVEQGVPMLRDYLKEKDRKLFEERKKDKKDDAEVYFESWMDLVPLEEFHATQNQFLKAFLRWAIKDKEDVDDKDENKHLIVNASKARRRLDSYFDWMKDNMAKDLSERPLTLESVSEVAKIWDLQTTHDEEGRLVWWFDLSRMDFEKTKAADAMEQLRYVVWYSHLILFDKKAQENGIILMEDFNKIGFWKCMTFMPMELSAKMDRLTIGVLPCKMKAIYMFGAARWVNLMMTLMKPFLSKKMRGRLIVVTETMAPDRQKYVDDLINRENIPDGCMGLQGGTPIDAMYEKFKKKMKKKDKKKKKKEEEAQDGEE